MRLQKGDKMLAQTSDPTLFWTAFAAIAAGVAALLSIAAFVLSLCQARRAKKHANRADGFRKRAADAVESIDEKTADQTARVEAWVASGQPQISNRGPATVIDIKRSVCIRNLRAAVVTLTECRVMGSTDDGRDPVPAEVKGEYHGPIASRRWEPGDPPPAVAVPASQTVTAALWFSFPEGPPFTKVEARVRCDPKLEDGSEWIVVEIPLDS